MKTKKTAQYEQWENDKWQALQEMKVTGQPVKTQPLPNGVVVVYIPNGGNRNFVNDVKADEFIAKWQERQ